MARGTRGTKKYVPKTKKDNTMSKTKKDVNQDKRLDRVEKNVKELKTAPELKFFDTFANNVSVTSSTAGFLDHVTAIGQGTTTASRIGDEITVKSIYVKYKIVTPEGEQDPAWARILVVCDTQANQNNMTQFKSVSENGLLDNAVVADGTASFYNDRASQRYKVYYDKLHMIRQLGVRNFDGDTGEMQSALNMPHTGEVFIKLGRKIKYGSGTATYPITNAFYVVMTSDQSGGDEAPVFQVSTRLAYTDV